MDKGAIFLLFFPLIVIIIRTASYWLHQQHRTRMYLYQAQIMLTLALFLHFLHSVAVILRFSVYIWFGFLDSIYSFIIFDLFNIYYAIFDKCHEPEPMCPIHRYYIHAQIEACAVVVTPFMARLKSMDRAKERTEWKFKQRKKFRHPKSIWSVKKTHAHINTQIQRIANILLSSLLSSDFNRLAPYKSRLPFWFYLNVNSIEF